MTWWQEALLWAGSFLFGVPLVLFALGALVIGIVRLMESRS